MVTFKRISGTLLEIYVPFQQEECLRRILAQPGRIISIVYQLDDGEFVIDDCAEAVEDVVAEGEHQLDDEDLDQLFERARRDRGRLERFWRRWHFGSYSIISYSSKKNLISALNFDEA